MQINASVNEGTDWKRQMCVDWFMQSGSMWRCVHIKEHQFSVNPWQGHGQAYLLVTIYVDKRQYCVCFFPLQNDQNKTQADT